MTAVLNAMKGSRQAWRCICGAQIFFRNSQCLSCQRQLAYEPQSARMLALQAIENAWVVEDDSTREKFYRCDNFSRVGCNWLRPASFVVNGECLCLACSLNRKIPDLSHTENLAYWSKTEVAKRRLISQLLSLKLPVQSRVPSPWQNAAQGLAFDFLRSNAEAVLTGHENGIITLNIQEADDAYREQTRLAFHEPSRTLLGHLRHEIGHYYWQRLISQNSNFTWLESFRSLFGDEQQDYTQALKKYYEHGAKADWQNTFISAYASSHPWEDWAETWAHYLHMRDAMETAQSLGLKASSVQTLMPTFEPHVLWNPSCEGAASFLGLINHWLPLTSVFNELSDSLGQAPFYPFVLHPAVIKKLHFMHELIEANSKSF